MIMDHEKTTEGRLREALHGLRLEELPEFLVREKGAMLAGPRPFAGYLRRKLREKGLLQQEVFLAADLSESYGYKLISQEKHTRQRDTILKLCLGAGFTLDETQRALKIYGMSPLYARFPPDAVLISAISSGTREPAEINRLLEQNGQPQLRES
jgi:hypothetical protein